VTDTQNNTVTGNSPKKNKPWLIALTALLLLAAAAAIYLMFFNDSNTGTNSKFIYSYKPSETTTAFVEGSGSKRGMEFNMPSALKIIWTPAPKNQKAFMNLVSNPKYPKSTVAVARVVADAYNYSSSDLPNAKFYQEMSDQFSLDPSSKQYQDNLKNLYTVAKIAIPEKGMTVKIAGAKEFTNPNIHKNAWVLDITATDPAGKIPNHTGKILWIGGSHSFYHFLVMADDEDWNNQSAIWQSVLNSIRIDL
jgi:hypothetical protein